MILHYISISLGIGFSLGAYMMFKDDEERQPLYIYAMIPVWILLLSLPFIMVAIILFEH